MSRCKCIIVEDEPLAQNVLKKYIADHPSLELIATCTDALEAQVILRKENIQLIFLDINLPKLSGINFIKTLLFDLPKSASGLSQLTILGGARA